MSLIPDQAAFQNSLASLPLVTYQPGETVIADGSRTGRLLILRKGAVAIVKEDTEIAKVAEPGAVFGELSLLLDQPTRRTCALWSDRSSTWPMRPRCSTKIRSQCSILPLCWPAGSTAQTMRLFN